MIRPLTIALALWYFFAAAVHAGWVPAVGAPLGFAPFVEATLGAVLVVTAVGALRPMIGYILVLAGTLFGFTIVVARGLAGFDLVAHIVMLAGLTLGLILIFGSTRRYRSP